MTAFLRSSPARVAAQERQERVGGDRDLEIELGAPIAGLGIICTFEEFLREALDRGDLTEVLADWRQSFSGPFVYYRSRNMPAPLRAFVDFARRDAAP